MRFLAAILAAILIAVLNVGYSAGAHAESFAIYVPPNVKIAKRQDRPTASEVIGHAMKFLGTRYVWGSCELPPGLDCSGFMIRLWSDMGYGLPRVSRHQSMIGTLVGAEQLAPADLMFFTKEAGGDYINHVGLYLGNGEFIHAAMGSGKVTINSLTGYFRRHFSHGRRILPLGPGLVVEKDQSAPIALGGTIKTAFEPGEGPKTPKSAISDKERSAGEKALEGIVLPETLVDVADSATVTIGDVEVSDADLVRQLQGVNTADPNQFEHAGEEPSPFFLLGEDMFAGAAAPAGPRHLTRNEHTAGLKTGSTTFAGRQSFYLSPELNLFFPNINFAVNLGFPVPYVSAGGAQGTVWAFKWATDGGTWRDYTRFLRQIRFGEAEAPLYFDLTRYATTTIGHGQLVKNLSASLASPFLVGSELGHQALTWHGDVTLKAFSFESQVDDVLNPHVFTVRAGLRPWALGAGAKSETLRSLTFGFEYGLDFNRVAAGTSVHLAQADLDLSVWRTALHETEIYLAASTAITSTQSLNRGAMAKLALGTLWRFKLGPTKSHGIRLRLEGFGGRARDTWLDNFEYAVGGSVTATRSLQKGGLYFEARYSFRETFELGGSYTPSFGPGNNYDAVLAADKIEGHLGVTNLPIHPSFRLTLQTLYQSLIFKDPSVTDAHYLLVDAHALIWRYFKTGAVLRKPLGGALASWEFAFDAGVEFSF